MINAELLVEDLYTRGFHIIETFLEPHIYQSLAELSKEAYEIGLFKHAKIGFQINHQQNERIRSDEIFWLDEASPSPAVSAYFEKIHAMAKILNQTLFLGLMEFETHFAIYQPGTFYKKHIDQFASTKTRTISCVYYLNEHWQESFGGELKLYNKEEGLIQTLYPEGNRFICFMSDLPHEVCLTHRPRYSIAGWMKKRSLLNT